jgi:glycosyltransferase involved in cell wall biosynthesis
MYCGNCLRDNALVTALRGLGHQVVMVPMYLPLTLDERDQSAGTPIFFSGINVYLQQKSAVFRQAPAWVRNLLASPALLKWAAGKAAKTRAEDLGELTLSMLRGEQGNQSLELEQLIAWLKTQPKPDVICLSNGLLIGLARQLKAELKTRVVCDLQGEDTFLDALPAAHRSECWSTLAERAAEADGLIAPSQYFRDFMCRRLGLPGDRVKVIHNGIHLDGYDSPAPTPAPDPGGAHGVPALGFFARMCREKGLDTLVDAYIQLRRRGRIQELRLRVGGSCGPADEPFVHTLRHRLNAAGLLHEVEFCPNLDRAAKVRFLRSLTAFSVPASYGEAFGLYLIEAMAAGVPVAQPAVGAFPELVGATGGGVICDPGAPSLAQALEDLLLDPVQARARGEKGRRAVFEHFTAESMARAVSAYYSEVGFRSGSGA